VVWPVTRFSSFENGAVGLGNMTIEPTNYTLASKSGGADGELFSLCLEPEPVEIAAAELGRREIPHSPPTPFVSSWPDAASTDSFHPSEPIDGKSTLWT
jgi:hypothetical protein